MILSSGLLRAALQIPFPPLFRDHLGLSWLFMLHVLCTRERERAREREREGQRERELS